MYIHIYIYKHIYIYIYKHLAVGVEPGLHCVVAAGLELAMGANGTLLAPVRTAARAVAVATHLRGAIQWGGGGWGARVNP